MKIDSHLHISLFENNAGNLEGAFALLKKDMATHGIDYAIVIPDNIEHSPDIADLRKAQELIKGSDSFFLLGSPQIIQRGSTEIEEYRKLLTKGTIKGIKLFPGHDPYYPNDERCFPYYRLCDEFGAPILFHTGANSNDPDRAQWNDPQYIVAIAKEFPRLKIIIAHYFWPRMEYCYELTKDIPNIYFDTSAMADNEVIEESGGIEAVQKILQKTVDTGAHRVMFGTDWPMCSMQKHIDLIRSLAISKEVEDKIFYKNAIAVYNLPLG